MVWIISIGLLNGTFYAECNMDIKCRIYVWIYMIIELAPCSNVSFINGSYLKASIYWKASKNGMGFTWQCAGTHADTWTTRCVYLWRSMLAGDMKMTGCLHHADDSSQCNESTDRAAQIICYKVWLHYLGEVLPGYICAVWNRVMKSGQSGFQIDSWCEHDTTNGTCSGVVGCHVNNWKFINVQSTFSDVCEQLFAHGKNGYCGAWFESIRWVLSSIR